MLSSLLLVLASCETEADRRREQLDRLAHTIDARVAAANLPSVSEAPVWTPGDVRVVAGDGIDVDRAAVALAFYRADPVAYVESARPIPGPGIRAVALTGGRPDVAAHGRLTAALQPPPPPGTMGQPPSWWATKQGRRGSADLAIGARIPYATFAEILTTVVRERFAPRLVVRTPGALGELPIRTPPIVGCRQRGCIVALVGHRTIPDVDPDADSPSGSGLDLTLAIDGRGVDIFGSGGALAPGCEALRPAEDGGPTVPRVEGAIDRQTLEACLNEIATLFPDDDDARIQPQSDTPLDEVALVASVAFGDDRFPGLFFAEPE